MALPIFNTGSETWAPGGTNEVEMGAATNTASAGVPGADWDLLNITGSLTITATNNAGDANKFTIRLVNYGTGANPTNFNAGTPYSWLIATTTEGVYGFNPAKFVVDTSLFGTAPAGTFSVVLVGKSVHVVYAPTADPCATATTASAVVVNDGADMQMTFINASQLTSVQALVMQNCTITGHAWGSGDADLGTVGSLSLTARTGLPAGTVKVVLTASKTGPGSATVNAIAIDTCGRGKSFDPVITTLVVKSGHSVQQRFEGVFSAERYLQVVNGAPGLKSLAVAMNGHKFRLDPLADAQSVSADLGAAMIEGDQNVAVLTGSGEVGASALVLITDTPLGVLVQLPEVAELTLAPAADRVQVSWPQTLTGWQLQTSEALATGWTDVVATPAAADGRCTVTVGVGGIAQFFRLHEAGAAASTVPGKTTGVRAASDPTTAPTQLSKRTYDGILW